MSGDREADQRDALDAGEIAEREQVVDGVGAIGGDEDDGRVREGGEIAKPTGAQRCAA